jgi:pSer/pThr/pTyr-binding forkhead associated (FHA) protein
MCDLYMQCNVKLGHNCIVADDERITVTDLRSTNGTYVDGEEIEAMQAYEVTPGSRIIFGDEHLAMYEVMLEEDPAPEPPAEAETSSSS